jgi:hypothetical protein
VDYYCTSDKIAPKQGRSSRREATLPPSTPFSLCVSWFRDGCATSQHTVRVYRHYRMVENQIIYVLRSCLADNVLSIWKKPGCRQVISRLRRSASRRPAGTRRVQHHETPHPRSAPLSGQSDMCARNLAPTYTKSSAGLAPRSNASGGLCLSLF